MDSSRAVLEYIENYWSDCTFAPKDRRVATPRNALLRTLDIHLPNRSVSPNHRYFARTQYYWDSYFIIRGLLRSGRIELAIEIFAFLFQKLHIMPARNTHFSRGRTQPPFFAQMVREVYECTKDQAWLNTHMEIALQEYRSVWQARPRYVEEVGLNRYHPKYFPSILGVYESGWDVSSRFALRAKQIIPVDLNCLLYRYEDVFEWWSAHTNDTDAVKQWQVAKKQRAQSMREYLWNEHAGFYFDHELHIDKPSKLHTLAGFFPMYVGLASKEEAARMVQHLLRFEHSGGLATSEKKALSIRQWDYPNGWPNIILLVVLGLKKYGYDADALMIATNFLQLQNELFEQSGVLWEKYDVVNRKPGRAGRYPTQSGFGWTNAAYLELYDLVL